MKKISKIITLVLLVVVLAVAFVACGDPDPNSVSGTARGTGANTWHFNENFIAVVDVSVENGEVTQISIVNAESYIMTDVVVPQWVTGKTEYIQQFLGLTVTQVRELSVTNTQDRTNHFDGGKIESELVHAVTGATSSSVTVALAIKDAVERIVKNA